VYSKRAMECHGRAIAYIWERLRASGRAWRAFCCDQIVGYSQLLREEGRPGVVRSGTPCAERMSTPRRAKVGLRARA